MKFLIFVCIAVAAVVHADDKFTTKYDNFDVDNVLKNKRLLNSYFNCILTGEKCTNEGAALRDAIPQALQDGCAKCSQKQKQVAEKVIPVIARDHPEKFRELRQAFDKDNQFFIRYKDLAEKHGIKP